MSGKRHIFFFEERTLLADTIWIIINHSKSEKNELTKNLEKERHWLVLNSNPIWKNQKKKIIVPYRCEFRRKCMSFRQLLKLHHEFRFESAALNRTNMYMNVSTQVYENEFIAHQPFFFLFCRSPHTRSFCMCSLLFIWWVWI